VNAVLKDSKADKLTKDSSNFWVLVNALKGFMDAEGHGSFPGSTAIPDMVCESENYVKLKSIYKEKADNDLAAISKRVATALSSIGRKPDSIGAEEVANFVKSCRCLKVVRTRPLAAEYDSKSFSPASIASAMEDEGAEYNHLEDKDKNANIYFAMRAVDSFFAKNKRYPQKDDAAAVNKLANALLKELTLTLDCANWIDELIRAQQGELHNIGAFMGGVVSQEALKILMHQYVPINNTFIFNGQAGRGVRLEM